jgi:hypothetical protein
MAKQVDRDTAIVCQRLVDGRRIAAGALDMYTEQGVTLYANKWLDSIQKQASLAEAPFSPDRPDRLDKVIRDALLVAKGGGVNLRAVVAVVLGGFVQQLVARDNDTTRRAFLLWLTPRLLQDIHDALPDGARRLLVNSSVLLETLDTSRYAVHAFHLQALATGGRIEFAGASTEATRTGADLTAMALDPSFPPGVSDRPVDDLRVHGVSDSHPVLSSTPGAGQSMQQYVLPGGAEDRRGGVPRGPGNRCRRYLE